MVGRAGIAVEIEIQTVKVDITRKIKIEDDLTSAGNVSATEVASDPITRINPIYSISLRTKTAKTDHVRNPVSKNNETEGNRISWSGKGVS